MSIIYLASLFSRLSASAIWIACMSFFWIAILCDLDGQPYDYMAGVVLCLITFAVYAYDHVSSSREDLLNNPHRACLANWPIKPLAAIAYLLAVVLVCIWDSSRLFAVLAPGLAGYLYTSRIGGYRPKDLPGCKTLIVAASTSICRAGLIQAGIEIYLFVFIAMVIDTVLCDCRDVCGDATSGVRTLPVLLGPSRTMLVLIVFDALLFAISPVVAAVGCLLIVYFRKNRNVLAYDLLVDGWMMWSWLLILIFAHFHK